MWKITADAAWVDARFDALALAHFDACQDTECVICCKGHEWLSG
jgi:hypothetical protein